MRSVSVKSSRDVAQVRRRVDKCRFWRARYHNWDENIVSSSRELPSNEQKVQRNSHHELFAVPVKTWMKTSTLQMLSEIDGDARSHPHNGVNLSPEMSSDSNFKYFLPFHHNTPGSSNMDGISHHKVWKCDYAYKSIPHSHREEPFSHVDMDYFVDYDQPLDMSKKCVRKDDDIKSSNSLVQKQQQQRPTVITCAPSLKDSHPKSSENQDIWYGNNNCSGIHKDGSDSHEERSRNILESRPGHRREIVSGMCDPVIEEHFRRSLGKDYTEVFSSSSTSVSITVDDHFAKALGDTWIRLQKTKLPDDHSSTMSAQSPPPSPPVLQHPQEVVSS